MNRKQLDEILANLLAVEILAADNALRDRLLNQQIDRTRSWKTGVYKS